MFPPVLLSAARFTAARVNEPLGFRSLFARDLLPRRAPTPEPWWPPRNSMRIYIWTRAPPTHCPPSVRNWLSRSNHKDFKGTCCSLFYCFWKVSIIKRFSNGSLGTVSCWLLSMRFLLRLSLCGRNGWYFFLFFFVFSASLQNDICAQEMELD